MIAQIEGKLVSLEEDKALVSVGPVCYEVLLPGYAVSALSGSIGATITLSTTGILKDRWAGQFNSATGGLFVGRRKGVFRPIYER